MQLAFSYKHTHTHIESINVFFLLSLALPFLPSFSRIRIRIDAGREFRCNNVEEMGNDWNEANDFIPFPYRSIIFVIMDIMHSIHVCEVGKCWTQQSTSDICPNYACYSCSNINECRLCNKWVHTMYIQSNEIWYYGEAQKWWIVM